MKKSLKNSILLLLLAFVLVGCSNGQSETVQEPAETPVETTETTGEEVVQTEEEVVTEENIDTPAPETTPVSESTTNNLGIENVEYPVSINQAVELFYSNFGSQEINIDSIEFDRDDGHYRYEINGWDGEFEYSLDIDAETGEVREQEKDTDRDIDGIIDINSIISPSEAMAIALEKSGSGYVTDWELDTDDGRVVYDVDIENGSDQKVDAYTGEVY